MALHGLQINLSVLDKLVLEYVDSEDLCEFYGSSGSASTTSNSSKKHRDMIARVRDLVESGNVQEAVRLVQAHVPAVLEDQRLLFQLHKQTFIEVLRAEGDQSYSEAIKCSRQLLGPCALDAFPEAYGEFKRVMLTLMYDRKDKTSPVAEEWSEERRAQLAATLASALRMHLGGHDPLLSLTLRYLVSVYNRHGARFEPIADAGTGGPPESLPLVSKVASELLMPQKDPASTPTDSLYEAPSFRESDVQALVQAVDLTRQGAVDSLRCTSGDVSAALKNELSRLRVRAGVLDELVHEYCIYRGLVEVDRISAPSAPLGDKLPPSPVVTTPVASAPSPAPSQPPADSLPANGTSSTPHEEVLERDSGSNHHVGAREKRARYCDRTGDDTGGMAWDGRCKNHRASASGSLHGAPSASMDEEVFGRQQSPVKVGVGGEGGGGQGEAVKAPSRAQNGTEQNPGEDERVGGGVSSVQAVGEQERAGRNAVCNGVHGACERGLGEHGVDGDDGVNCCGDATGDVMRVENGCLGRRAGGVGKASLEDLANAQKEKVVAAARSLACGQRRWKGRAWSSDPRSEGMRCAGGDVEMGTGVPEVDREGGGGGGERGESVDRTSLAESGDCETGVPMEVDGEDVSCLMERYEKALEIRELANEGQTSKVVAEVQQLDPEFFHHNPTLLFQLKQVEFLQMVERGEYAKALAVARGDLGPLAAKFPNLLQPLKGTLLALAHPRDEPLVKPPPPSVLASALQVALGASLGVAEPMLMKLVCASLHAHTEWFKLQMCSDPFAPLLCIDALKEPDIDPASGMATTSGSASTEAAADPSGSCNTRGVDGRASGVSDNSTDPVQANDTAILTLMEFMALSRGDAIQLLAQYDWSVESVFAQLLA